MNRNEILGSPQLAKDSSHNSEKLNTLNSILPAYLVNVHNVKRGIVVWKEVMDQLELTNQPRFMGIFLNDIALHTGRCHGLTSKATKLVENHILSHLDAKKRVKAGIIASTLFCANISLFKWGVIRSGSIDIWMICSDVMDVLLARVAKQMW